MLEGIEVIAIYENVSAITSQMLLAAQQKDLARLAVLESQCAQQIDIIKNRGPLSPVAGVLRERKIDLLKKILQDDRLIRNVTQPWLTELQALIQNTGNQNKLARHYLANDRG
jgi:flagellar protein FliT